MLSHRPSRRGVVFLLLATAVLLAILDSANFGPIERVRANALAVGRPAASVLGMALRPVSTGWNGVIHYDDVQEENHLLRKRVAELEGQATNQLAADIELQAILSASDISNIGEAKAVTARVVTDRRTPTDRIIEIDKGADHGLRHRLPVVTAGGLVGHVDVVSDQRSTIKLVTSDDVAIGIRTAGGLALTAGAASGGVGVEPPIDGTETEADTPDQSVAGPALQPERLSQAGVQNSAAIIGRPTSNVDRGEGRVPLAVEFSPDLQQRYEDRALERGALFVTSGLNDSQYPPGIPVGYLRPSRAEPTIESAANLVDLSYLTVLVLEDES